MLQTADLPDIAESDIYRPDNRIAGRLVLEDGTVFDGWAFGHPASIAGEVVFNTGMAGYPDTLTDPSYRGQILTLTYPLIGNYGVPSSRKTGNLNLNFESNRIQVQALVVSDYSLEYSHWNAARSLSDWLKSEKIPAITGIDTRSLTQILREKGAMLGKIEFGDETISFYNPNLLNLVAETSIDKPVVYGEAAKRVVLIDCGAKHNILHNLLSRDVQVLRVPWDYDLSGENFDGLMISNGPGDPKTCRATVETIRGVMARDIPVFGICMGHQLLSLAAGANTYKLKYGHRSQNQPVIDVKSGRCLITSQNHGFAVDDQNLPDEWETWFVNLNDNTNEGISHKSKPFRSVQFHPEAAPGPVDADYLFDDFIRIVNNV